jgi:hypothetical protein
MKRAMAVLIVSVLVAPSALFAQAPPAGQKTLAASMGIYAFPTKGQDAAHQSQDESACYQFAIQQTSVDPFHLQKQTEAAHQQNAAAAQQQAAQASQAGQGAVAGSVARGAAAGALVGGVSNGSSSGEGAAVGAAAGLIAGARRKKAAQAQAQAQAQEQAAAQASAIDQNAQAQMTEFKKAFSACMQAKNYTVQY